MPRHRAGKMVDAESPKAKATTWATKPGGYIPNNPATNIATAAEHLAYNSSCLSVIFGMKVFLSKSWETDADITKSNPAFLCWVGSK